MDKLVFRIFGNMPAQLPALFFLFAIVLNGCESVENKPPPTKDTNSADSLLAKQLVCYNRILYPALKKEIEHGAIVFRLGSDVTSEMFRLLNPENKTFSHCGIASIENDSIFIYHAIGGELNPDEVLMRQTLYEFAHPVGTRSIGYKNPLFAKDTLSKLIGWVRSQHKKQITFDMNFDYNTNDKMYCTEFVAKAVGTAMNNYYWLPLRKTGNKSYITPDQLIHAPSYSSIHAYKF